MRFLLDQGVRRTVVDLLADAGIACEHVGSLGLDRASDTEVLQAAAERNATLVTFDSDFHAILAATKGAKPSVIRIRIEGVKAKRVAAILLEIVSKIGPQLEQGVAVSVDAERVRVHSLPLGRK